MHKENTLVDDKVKKLRRRRDWPITYFNMKTAAYGVETIDELDSIDYLSLYHYGKEVRRLLREYRISGHGCYTSRRCTKEWRER